MIDVDGLGVRVDVTPRNDGSARHQERTQPFHQDTVLFAPEPLTTRTRIVPAAVEVCVVLVLPVARFVHDRSLPSVKVIAVEAGSLLIK